MSSPHRGESSIDSTSHDHASSSNSCNARSSFGSTEASFKPKTSNLAGMSEPQRSSSASQNSDRVKKILRTTESNILILLSRISLKTNPTPYLIKCPILSTLTSYFSISPWPFQRCIRTLLRLCRNPLCFESLLLEQAPALIVKNLILDQDGSLPVVLFKDRQEGGLLGPFSSSRKINFDEMFPSSQGSDTASDFGHKMEFEFGGDAYSRMMSSLPSHAPLTSAISVQRSLSVDSQCARDNPEVYTMETSDNVDDRIKSRVGIGIRLMKALSSIALSRYGDGEIQRIWSRGTKSNKLACTISLLHMPIGCGPLHRHLVVFKHDTLHQVIPLLFMEESAPVRESIVTALSLLAHLTGITKLTPEISRLKPCPDSHHDNGLPPLSPSPNDSTSSRENGPNIKLAKIFIDPSSLNSSGTHEESESVGGKGFDITKSNNDSGVKEELKTVNGVGKDVVLHQREDEKEGTLCSYERLSGIYNLNLMVVDEKSGEKKAFRAYKEILMRKSDVFSAMLGGGYAEADKVDIEISDVSVSGFEYIVHYLHGCESGCVVIDSLLSPCSCDIIDSSSSSNKLFNAENSCPSGDKVHAHTTRNEKERPKFPHLEHHAQTAELSDENKRVDLSICDQSQSISSQNSNSIISTSDAFAEKQVQNIIIPTSSSSHHLLSTETPKQIMLNDRTFSSPLSTITKQTASDSPLNSNPLTSTTSTSAKEDTGDDSHTHMEHIDVVLAYCVDILIVADRFLLHDLIKFMTSVLSHHCLCTRTSQDVLYLASNFKLDDLALDCVTEVLLSRADRKDVAWLFVNLGLDLDMKEILQNALKKLLSKSQA